MICGGIFTTGNRPRREIFFTTERNGRKTNGKGTEKTECKDGSVEWAWDVHTVFLYFGLPPDVQKGCPFNGRRVLHFDEASSFSIEK